jgi:TRAP-type C4-dicarboxylate transport system permease small subunit
MRYFLDAVYRGAAALAALFMLALLGVILLNIIGRELGWYMVAIDGYAGYFMAANGFLALAHTLNSNGHVRVTWLFESVQANIQPMVEIWSVAVGFVLSSLLSYYSIRLVVQSFRLNDIATSMDATPLWIPQLSMAVGTVIFSVALLDRLCCALLRSRNNG